MMTPVNLVRAFLASSPPLERVNIVDSNGQTYRTWRPVVRRIPQYALDTVVFHYQSVPDANTGKNVQGSGFLVGVASTSLPGEWWHVYAITARHVILPNYGNAPVIRRQTGDKVTVLPLDSDAWIVHDERDDVAVAYLGFLYHPNVAYMPWMRYDQCVQRNELFIEANTAMTHVVPAWKIQEVLDMDTLRSARAHDDAELAAEIANSPVTLDATDPTAWGVFDCTKTDQGDQGRHRRHS